MPNRRKTTMDIREMLRLMQLGQSNRQIAAVLQINRKTVDKYYALAREKGLLEGELPALEDLERQLKTALPQQKPPQTVSSVEPYRDTVVRLRQQGVEIAAIRQRLRERFDYQGSYASVWRFVSKLEDKQPEATVRVEVNPGEEGQVDFGSAGRMIDPQTGKPRKAWVFVMTLSWSRHQYVEFVFDQKVETWLWLHRNALTFFGGVPERLVIDNLKAAIVRACWHDPQVQRAYRECAEHYGFWIAPCQPGKPEHKGKVEQGGVHYVKRNYLAGRDPQEITGANQDVLRWVEEVAGQRVHGTTRQKPLVRFAEAEQAALQPLPAASYEPGLWKQVKLHRDCHVVFEKSYYSAPHRLIGQQLWVRGGLRDVRLYTEDHHLVAVHSRAQSPGQRQTILDHLPAEKVPGLILSRPWCRQQAARIGPATSEVVQRLLEHRPEDRLRSAGRLLQLSQRFQAERLEAACRRALHFDDPAYLTVKRILEAGLDQQPLPQYAASPPATTFVRNAQEFARQLLRGASWS